MDHDLIRALLNPIRMEIIEIVRRRPASPAEISAETGHRAGVIAYHATALLRSGCLELVERRPRGGGIENVFAVAPGSIVGFQLRRPPEDGQAPEGG